MKRRFFYQLALLLLCLVFLSACKPCADEQKPIAATNKPAAATQKPAEVAQKPKGKSVLDELTEEDFLLQKPLSQEEFDKMAEEVVAVVGGKEIKKKNVWEAFSVPRDNNQIPPFNRQLLDQAIENELLYQEGLRRGLNKTEEFKSLMEKERLNRWKSEVPRLAARIGRKKLDEFNKAMPPSTPSPKEVEELFDECRASFPKETVSDEQVRETLRTLLGKGAPYAAYQKWLADLFDSAKMRVNGNPLELAEVSRSLRNFSLADGIKGVKAGQREAQMTYDAIRKALPGDTDVSKLKIEINNDSFEVGDRPELQGIIRQAKTADKEKLGAATREEAKEFALKLFTIVKNHILAQEAKKEGISLADEGPLWGTPVEKRVIASMLIGKIVAEEPKVEPTKEEIVAFYRTHTMYQGMEIEAAKKKIYERLGSEKTRAAAFDRLKKRFPVKIVKSE
ncbi:MAG: hypothetical protein P8123_03250 [bacterium]